VRSQDEVARLRGLLHRLVIETASCLEGEASHELLAEAEAAAGVPWRLSQQMIAGCSTSAGYEGSRAAGKGARIGRTMLRSNGDPDPLHENPAQGTLAAS
jgi:hypothetical protein